MKERIYIAGSLFNEAEINQRKLEEKKLLKLGFDNIFNPINAPCNDKAKLPTADDIFLNDTHEILNSDIVIADISNSLDAGVFCELGIIWACNCLNILSKTMTLEDILKILKPKKVIAHLSDIRKGTADKYSKNYIPTGFNQYMVGMIEDTGVIKDNFDEVINEIKNYYISR